MPILADAYSDAHLNLDTLDRDISEALKKVEIAAGRFEETLKIKVDLDTAAADTKLKDLQLQAQRTREAIEANSATIKVDIDSDQVLSELAALEQLKADLSSDPINIGVEFDSVQADAKIQELKALLDSIDKNITIKMEIDGDFTNALSQLAELNAAKEQLDGDIEIDVNLNENVLDEFAAIETLKDEIGRDVNFGIDANTGDLLDDLAAIETLKQGIGRDVTVNVDVDTGGALAKLAALRGVIDALQSGGGLSGLFGGGGGLGALSSLAGPALIGAIVAAVAALGPFVTGLIGGAVALIGFGAAAGVAAGGLAALALFTDTGLKETFATLGSNFARLTRDVLDPLITFFEDTVGPALFSVLTELTLKLGPSIQGFLTPIIGTFFEFFTAIANSAAPLLDDLGTGIGVLINSFTKFVPTLIPVAELLAGPFFNALSGIIELFLGTAEAAGPAVAAVLNGIGDGARGLIEPINRVVTAFTPLLLSIGPGLSTALGQLGPLWDDIGRAIFTAVNLITDVINNIGLQNIIVLIGAVAAAFGAWPIALAAITVGLGQTNNVVETLRGAFNAFAPTISTIVDTVKTFAEAVASFFASLFESIDPEGFASGIEIGLAPIRLIGEALLALAPLAGTVIGQLANAFSVLLPLLAAFAAFKLIPLVASWTAAIVRLGGALINLGIQAVAAIGSMVGSFQSAGGGLQGLKSGLGSLVAGVGAAGVATAGLTAVIVAGTAVYSAWSSAKKNAEQASRSLADALLSETDAVQATGNTIQKGIQEAGLEEQFATLGLGYRDIGDAAIAAGGKIDEFRGQWQKSITIGNDSSQEFVPKTLEQLDSLEAKLQAKGVTLPDAVRKVFEANINTGGIISDNDIREIINRITNADNGVKLGLNDLRATFSDAKAEIENLDLNVPEDVLKPIQLALDENNFEKARDLLVALAQQFPELADAIQLAGVETDDYGQSVADANAALAELGIRAGDVWNAALPEASRALSKLAAGLEEGTIAAGSFERATKELNENQEAVGDTGQETVRRLQQGGRISEFFKIEAREIKSAAEQAQEFAQAFVSGVTLGGRLSEFVRNEAVEVDRTIYDFLENLRLQADNAKRLSALTAQGFGTLAVQLASLAGNPEQLRGFLDELGASGQAGFAAANGRLKAGIDEFAAVVRTLDPVTRQALGLDETLQQLEEDQGNIFRALDQFAGNFRLKISNLQRLNQLQAQGFLPLAVQLGELFSDPAALDAALNQLDAAGTAAKAAANRQFTSLNDAYIQAAEASDDAIAAAIGFDKTKEKITTGQASVTDAIASYGRNVLIQLQNVARLIFLRTAGFGNVAAFIASNFADDPEGLQKALDNFVAQSAEAKNQAETDLANIFNAGSTAVAGLNQFLIEFPAPGTEAVAEQKNNAFASGIEVATSYNDGVQSTIKAELPKAINSATAAAFASVGATTAEGPTPPASTPGGPPPNTIPAPPSNAERTAALYAEPARLAAEAFANGFAGKLNEIAGAIIQASFEAEGGFLSLVRQLAEPDGTAFQIGTDISAQLLQGFKNGLTDSTVAEGVRIQFQDFGNSLLEDPANTNAGELPNAFESLIDRFKSQGVVTGRAFVEGLEDGLSGVTGIEGTDPSEEINNQFAEYEALGAGIGATFNAGLQTQAEAGGLTFIETLSATLGTLTPILTSQAQFTGIAWSASLAGGIGSGTELVNLSIESVLSSFAELLQFAVVYASDIGRRSAESFGTSFLASYAVQQLSIAQQIGLSLASINQGIVTVLGEGGRAAGDALGKAMVAGINNPLVLQQLRTAVFFFVAEAQITIRDSGPDIGRAFINGIDAGVNETAPTLLTTIGNIARLIAAAMEQALDINSPSGVGMTIGNQFIEGIVVGLQAATGELNTVATGVRSALVGALAEPVDINTAIVGTPGVAGFGVAAPAAAVVASPAAPVSDTILLQQMLTELQAQNAELRAVASRPLIGEYNVATTREPQSPDQLAQDAAFAKALLL
jgi:hypothetical protein